MEDFYDEIRREYPELFKKKKKRYIPMLPYVLSIFLVLATFVSLIFKLNNNIDVLRARELASVTLKNYMDYKIESLEAQDEKLGEKIKTCYMRVHLLGVLHNENWSIYNKTHCQREVMFVKSEDGKWYIKHMPRHLYIDPITKIYIEENYLGG